MWERLQNQLNNFVLFSIILFLWNVINYHRFKEFSKMNRKFKFRKKTQDITLKRFIPNMITISALCVGLTAIKFSLSGKLEFAILCLLFSAVLDATDGRLARYIGVTSNFGAELDSLADFVNFGVSPAIISYIVSLRFIGELGWGIALFFIICSGLRLARFNSTKFYNEHQEQEWEHDYSVGVPAPAGAICAVLPIIFCLATQNPSDNTMISPLYLVISFLFSGILMVSKIRTFVFKNFKITNSSVYLFVLLIGIFIICMMTKLWWTMVVISVLYLLSIPLSHKKYLKKMNALDITKVNSDNDISE